MLQLLDDPAALAEQFRIAAAATGKPRGLRWKGCELHRDVVFADDRATGELYALIGATIRFEAIEGGGMEEVEAVSNLRYATAVFVHRGGSWTSDGRTVFNHSPQQALQRYEESLEPMPAPGEEAPAPGRHTTGDQ